MIDWGLAERIAAAVADRVPAADAGGVATEVDDYAARSAKLVSGYTGLVAADGLPGAETVDRAGWTA
ncbi:MAG: Zincin-like metallopeptidase, partial [Solirubrobacteraceae bacterium]|nr:Zincin-like metallopeptidase [Solirubrobacteraceae bacterium]